ncbi:DUF86 domain-containing protein [Agrobacterium rubi]|uniref:DUF86 domain-containing protein n=1 Tax=Agrobacterium rubi TaxID=28099 RepID=A0AAE7UQI7_9HYPH|nr:DUF86 domain-containing protein [Agrobacterium rubi]NTE87046.1 DUF86 domain-containing protein [Agrobacterium rubi]NTF02980.1 DUF86 domain-containing protein [Agrobacterium rubi]NTF37224.1 DUF86 domain-containing protein [Agrobacterium rubi]OCJ55206.1 hypothetical protein A6U92_00895 [Agrobacterium rubi]QTF99649.1 DUF86 domain-containing protein [Agrobacterium rubi]
MSSDRLTLYLDEIDLAASRVQSFIQGMDEATFCSDERTQMAVMMGLAIIGEAVAKIDKHSPEFLREHTDVPWVKIKGMRNLIVHDYFRTELPVVWKTVTESIPDLQARMALIRNWRAQGE